MINTEELQGHWKEIRGKVKEKWGQLTDDDLYMINDVDQLIGRIQQKTGQARAEIETFFNQLMSDNPMLSQAKEKMVGYAKDAAESVRGTYNQVADQAREGYDQAERMVRNRPAESMFVLLGVGMLTGVALGLLMQSDRS